MYLAVGGCNFLIFQQESEDNQVGGGRVGHDQFRSALKSQLAKGLLKVRPKRNKRVLKQVPILTETGRVRLSLCVTILIYYFEVKSEYEQDQDG